MGLWDRTRRWAAESDTVRRWRTNRYELFLRLCAVQPDERILDVGVGAGASLERFNAVNPIVGIDLEPAVDSPWLRRENVTVETADGTALPYENGAFPVVFSNSVIEHVPRSLQKKFADEIRRVGHRYFVQTPNRYFPIEPHYQAPFVQFLPRAWRQWLNRHVTLGWRTKGHWEEIELLSAQDLARLFPDAEIHRERVFGLTKSLMAVRR